MKILCIACIALLGIIDLFLVIAVRALEKRGGEPMSEYIVKETNYPLASGQEVVGELIRCKDCKHRIEHKHYGDLGESAYTCEGNMVGWILPDDFCSHAKRKNGGAV